jgi:transcriptional regulator with XRE-family HTH domain
LASRPDITVQFGERVREVRQSRSLSQEALADLAGLDRTYISSVERGRRNISLRNIEAIADALGVGLADLLKGLGAKAGGRR